MNIDQVKQWSKKKKRTNISNKNLRSLLFFIFSEKILLWLPMEGFITDKLGTKHPVAENFWSMKQCCIVFKLNHHNFFPKIETFNFWGNKKHQLSFCFLRLLAFMMTCTRNKKQLFLVNQVTHNALSQVYYVWKCELFWNDQ